MSKHATSTAPTKAQRRQENWGKRNTVRPTTRRRFSDPRGHASPQDGMNAVGTRWAGWSKPNKRKPFPPMRTNWRDWWRTESLRRWRAS